ncbi:MAG: Apocarotenoid-15,15'-oxygenase [Synechococcales cyanobacterium RM1_1_8]|nr:Apocarotenoid-15,15'-oxygenase [Synechococcales cyanobacterium RM1_1_8]
MISTPSPLPAAANTVDRFSREDWQRGYQTQPQETSYWVEDIQGEIPASLRGTLFRNGPGTLDVGGQRFHHPFDGDGMICAFTFIDGKVFFRNRYVRTPGFIAEQAAGKILYRGVFGTQRPGGPLANAFDLKLKNIANTGVHYWGERLLALWEAAEPFRLDPVSLDTLGPDHLDGLLSEGQPFSAHPRIDPGSPRTGGQRRFVNFGVKAGLSSAIALYEFHEDGSLAQEQTRTVPGFAFLHDFVLTENYYCFFQNPVKFNPLPFVFGLKGAGQCLAFDPKGKTQMLLIPRDPAQPMQTLETDSCFVFHHGNAFERVSDQGRPQLVVDSICYPSFPSVEPGADFMETNFEEVPPGQLFRFTAELEGGSVSREALSLRPCEFPSLHPAKVGQAARYYYIGVTDSPAANAPLQAILKQDLETGATQTWSAAPRGFISEPLFVPAPNSKADGEAEDEGWVLCLIYNAARHGSDLVILQAQSLTEVARIRLQQHIPYGLHGSFTAATFGVGD